MQLILRIQGMLHEHNATHNAIVAAALPLEVATGCCWGGWGLDMRRQALTTVVSQIAAIHTEAYPPKPESPPAAAQTGVTATSPSSSSFPSSSWSLDCSDCDSLIRGYCKESFGIDTTTAVCSQPKNEKEKERHLDGVRSAVKTGSTSTSTSTRRSHLKIERALW